MNVYSDQTKFPWNARGVDKLIIRSDYLCTANSIGHAVAARKVNVSCADERVRGQWILIDSQDNNQYVVDLSRKFEKCFLATYNVKGWIAEFSIKDRDTNAGMVPTVSSSKKGPCLH